MNERQGVDIQSNVEELNKSLRNRDKIKDDAVAQLYIGQRGIMVEKIFNYFFSI